jgi:hypothetical protein
MKLYRQGRFNNPVSMNYGKYGPPSKVKDKARLIQEGLRVANLLKLATLFHVSLQQAQYDGKIELPASFIQLDFCLLPAVILSPGNLNSTMYSDK